MVWQSCWQPYISSTWSEKGVTPHLFCLEQVERRRRGRKSARYHCQVESVASLLEDRNNVHNRLEACRKWLGNVQYELALQRLQLEVSSIVHSPTRTVILRLSRTRATEFVL
jgi:hypothetical protein